MNALDLMARLGGETLNNKIRAVVDGDIVIVARMVEQHWEYTEAGQLLANKHSNLAVAENATPKIRKKATPAVESTYTPAENVAQEPVAAAK